MGRNRSCELTPGKNISPGISHTGKEYLTMKRQNEKKLVERSKERFVMTNKRFIGFCQVLSSLQFSITKFSGRYKKCFFFERNGSQGQKL